MTIEDVKQCVSRIRNRVIAGVFRELDLIKQWGSGFRRILKDAEELGLPQPEIIEIGMRVRFIVYLSESIEVPTENHAGKEETAPRSGEQVTEQVRSLLICLEDYTSSDGLYRKTSGNNPLSQPPRTSCHYHPEPPR